MVGAEGDRPVGPALILAAALFGDHGTDHGDHVGVTRKMLVLVERVHHLAALDADVAQVQEVHAVGQRLEDLDRVVVRARPQRAGAERDTIGPQVDGIEDLPVMRLGRHDARQAEQREGRIVRVAAQAHAQLFGQRRHLRQEVDHVLLQLGLGDIVVFREVQLHIVEREFLCRAGQAKDDVAGELLLAGVIHLGEALRGLGDHIVGEALGSARALEDVDVECGEVDQVKAHAARAARTLPGQIGAGPVEHRHEVVADGLETGLGKVPHRGLPTLDMSLPLALLLLDVFRDGQRFDHVPDQRRRAAILARGDLALALRDVLWGPDRAGGNVVQGRDDALDASLHHVVNAHTVLRTEPTPGLTHR